MRHEEHEIQKAIVHYLDLALPSSYRAFAVPNGGWRKRDEAARLKAEGVKAGVPDICIVSRDGYCAFLETKTPRGTLSPAQREWRDWCATHRIPHAVVRSLADVEHTLTSWNIALRLKLT